MNGGNSQPSMKILKDKFAEGKQQSNSEEQLESLRKIGRFRGVKIDRCACKACSKFAGQVFSFNEAPSLPVEGCDAPSCSCQYLGMPNRRNDSVRRSDKDRRESIRVQENQRSGCEQRSSVRVWKGYDF